MKIPKKAKRVFKGEIFEVYQWRQKMFDGTFEIFEMLKRGDTIQILATQNGKILVTREEQPGHTRVLGLCGGRVDKGETSLGAAKRELLEEAGLVSSDWELYKAYVPHLKIVWKVFYYIARNCRKVAQPIPEAGERITVRKVGFEKFIELFSSEAYRGGEFTADILRMRSDKKKLKVFKQKLFKTSK